MPQRVIVPLLRMPRHHNNATTIIDMNGDGDARLTLRTLVPLDHGAEVHLHRVSFLLTHT
jgi:hypothetical protein